MNAIEPSMDWSVYGGIIGGAALLGVAAYVYGRPVHHNGIEPAFHEIQKEYQKSMRAINEYRKSIKRKIGGTRKIRRV
jgi:hypothetical protein